MNRKPWGGMDPNTQHQLWSEWIFEIWGGRINSVPARDVEENARRWLRMGFGSAGQVRFERTVWSWRFIVQAEGAPAQDAQYVASVRRQFDDFVEKGWGRLAVGTVKTRILAGDREDGQPPAQLVVMPHLVGGD